MRFLRSNTAVIITVGPFYDKTDGVTIETALTITNERITLTADTDAGSAPTNILDNITGATSGTANDLNYISGNDAGMMQMELAAADVNRLGRMFLSITDAANHVPVFHEFMVLNTAIYDALFASSGGAIPNVATGSAGALVISGTGTAALSTSSGQVILQTGTGTGQLDFTSGVVKANATQILGTAVSTPATAGILDVNVKNIDNDAASASGTVTFPNATLASTTNITAGTITTTTNLTNLPAITANWLTAAGTAADFGTEVAAAVWQDAVAGDFTVASSIGKSLYTGNVVPGGTNGLFIAGTNAATTVNITGTITTATNVTTVNGLAANIITAAATAADFGAEVAAAIWQDTVAGDFTVAASVGKSVMNGVALGTGLTVNAVTGLTASNLDTTVSSRMATYTQPTGFLAATFPSGTIANTTNITAGTITTATNVTTVNGLAAGVVTAASIATDAIDADALAADAVTEIQAGLATGAALTTAQADLDDIQARLPAALTAGGNMKSDALALSGDTVAADNAESFFDGTGYAGTNNVIPLVTTTTTATNLTNAATAGDLTATMKASVNAEADTALSDVGLTTTITGRVDVAVSTRLATAGYTAPDNTSIAAILVDTAEIGVAGAGLTAITGKTDNLPASPAATSDIPSAASIATAVWTYVTEGTRTTVQMMRGFAAALLGKASGLPTAPIFRDIDDSKDRITATTDADGNRSAITLDLT